MQTTLSLSVMTTVGYMTNALIEDFQSPASARCYQIAFLSTQRFYKKTTTTTTTTTNGPSIGLCGSYVTAPERNPSELSFGCLLISFDELI